MTRKQRERLAHIAFATWSPYDRPEVPDEASSKRLDALRRWRGQPDADEDEEASNDPDETILDIRRRDRVRIDIERVACRARARRRVRPLGPGREAGAMTKRQIAFIAAVGCLAVSCARQSSTVEQYRPAHAGRPMTFEEHCTAVIQALDNPYIGTSAKTAIYEKGKNDGCMGRSPAPDQKP